MSENAKRRRHTRHHSKRTSPLGTTNNGGDIEFRTLEDAEQHVDNATRAFMNELFDTSNIVRSTAGRNEQDLPAGDEDDEPESLREIIQLTEGTVSRTPQQSRLAAYTSYLSPFEEMAIVANVAHDPVIERIADRLATPVAVAATNYYVVRGLSDRVVSSQYETTRMQQAEIQAQLNMIDAGYERWSYFDQYARVANDRSTGKSRERAAECFRRLAEQFVPQPTVLKPASVSRALNARWRDLLISELQTVRARYLSETLRALESHSTAVNKTVIAEQYLDTLVDPFIQRQIEIIGTSNYDEMPLMWHTLREFFDGYLDNAAHYLSLPPPQRPPMNVEDEQITCFLANALELYAQPEFLRVWLPAWLARNPQKPSIEVALTTYVKRIVAYRQQQLEQIGRVGGVVPSYVYFYVPMTESDARAAYRTMIENDIALARARAVADNEAARGSLIKYINTPTAQFLEPSSMVYTIPSNFFAMLDLLVRISRSDLLDAYAAKADDNAATVASLENRHREMMAQLDAHVRQLEERLALYGETRARMTSATPHAPNDGRERVAYVEGAGNDQWSPYDLSYPLSPINSTEEINRLVTSVARSAEEFNTETQQERVHNIRRAIDRNYTLQLLERRRAELQYQLDVLTSPTTEVPQRIVHDVNAENTELLVITIGLSPQLEKRILTMSESLLEADERAAQDALATASFRVRWFFKPNNNRVPHATPTPPEIVVRDVRLPPGQLTDTYAPFLRDVADQSTSNSSEASMLSNIRHSLARAGVYRVEASVVSDDDDDPTTYRSMFNATIEVVSKCMRDDKLFEPMMTGSGLARHTCCWRQAQPSTGFDEYVEELVALVEHGPRAYQQLLDSRERSGLGLWRAIAAGVAATGLRMPLPLPPWGSSSPDQLVQTTYETRATLEQRFTFDRIYAAFRKRVGVLLAVLLRDNPTFERRFPSSVHYTPEELFNLYLDSTLTSTGGLLKLREEAAEYGIVGGGALMRPAEIVREQLPTDVALDGLVRVANRLIRSASLPDDPRLVAFGSTNDSVPVDGNILTIVHSEPTYVSDESLLSQLQRLANPFAQLLMTERERSFFSRIERDFVSFRNIYRERRKREMIWRRVECGGDQIGQTGKPINATLYQLAPSSMIGEQDSACLDTEIGRMTQTRVKRELEASHDDYGNVTNMFIDNASLFDYEQLVRNCLRQDDLAQLMRDRKRPYTPSNRYIGAIDIARQRLELPPLGESCCLDNGQAFDDVIPTWLGAHSAISDQPQPLVVGFTGRSVLGDGVYRRAYLYESGSQPARGNVDFNGLRNMIEAACTRYIEVVGELERRVPAPMTSDIRTEVTNARVHCEQLALVFNYFAFAAPPLRCFYEAQHLINEIQSGTQFAKLSFSLPLTEK